MTPIKAAADPSREALKPCPFCGGTNIKALAHLDWVACDDCGAALEDAEPSARELWNTRAAPAGNVGARQKPFAWVMPGSDTANDRGFIDAMAWEEGEFTKPLYASPSPIPEAPVVREEIKKILYSYHGATLSADEAADRIIRALKPQDGGDVVANEDISTNPAPRLHAFKPRNGGETKR